VDRHPAAAVTGGLLTLVWVSMMLSIHPLAAVTMIVTIAVGAAVYFAVSERRRREALAARADWENAQIVAHPFSRLREKGLQRAFYPIR
jgi:heme exporter protein D